MKWCLQTAVDFADRMVVVLVENLRRTRWLLAGAREMKRCW